MAGGSEGRSLEETPTWAVAVVCFVLVAISIVIEYIFHRTATWLSKKNKKALSESLEKIKAELMLLGFISLLLTVTQNSISKICIPKSVGHSWHPCRRADELDDGEYEDPCKEKGKVQFISSYGVHQLHIFIFVLAVTHVLYCVATLGLGRLKMRKWRGWEDETKTIEYQYYNDPERFRFARETSFGRRHMSYWSRTPLLLWIVCFFRQFFSSVAKVDYVTLRHGFVMAHLAPQSQISFNFQKYIRRALEDDFMVVVGVSPLIWFLTILVLLTNTNGWYSYFWQPFVPLIIVLMVGAKLQVIITKMGLRIQERGDVVKGTPVVQPGDELFWFNRPALLLFLIHFVLFENAFQLAFFAWSWYEFGLPSCFHENVQDIVIRLSMGVSTQVLCSYVTLPLYALVTQMGSTMKPVIFSEQVASALRKWYHNTRKRMKQDRQSENTTPYTSRPATPLHGMSPMHLLQRHQNNIADSLQTSPRASNYDDEGWDRGSRSSLQNNHREPIRDGNKDRLDPEGGEHKAEQYPTAPPSNGGQHEIGISLRDFAFDERKG